VTEDQVGALAAQSKQDCGGRGGRWAGCLISRSLKGGLAKVGHSLCSLVGRAGDWRPTRSPAWRVLQLGWPWLKAQTGISNSEHEKLSTLLDATPRGAFLALVALPRCEFDLRWPREALDKTKPLPIPRLFRTYVDVLQF